MPESASPDPTRTQYLSFGDAYDYFNSRLFDDRLPRCLITMQRRRNARGYFAAARFSTPEGTEITDEIALNPLHFRNRSTDQTLSTLVHEMCHLEQKHFGKAPKRAYHNRQWGDMMLAVGLHPSATGEPGGKQTGRNMTHYVIPDGAFEMSCADLLSSGFTIRYVELPVEEKEKPKAASKIKYACPGCKASAWAKPGTRLVCEDCQKHMESDSDDSDSVDA